MGLRRLTSRRAVLEAIEEYERLGKEEFLAKYRFGPSRTYFLRYRRRLYDSKAIVGAAYGYQHPDHGALGMDDFVGGKATVARKLEALGFEVIETGAGAMNPLRPGTTYSWDEVGSRFQFRPDYPKRDVNRQPR